MKIIVFGANGKVGRLVVAEALERGHEVLAFVHSTSNIPEHPRLKIIHGNIYDAKQVSHTVGQSRTVISALGSWGTPKMNILTAGMSNIIPAMQHAGITRIISLTGADAEVVGDTNSIFHKLSRSAFLVPFGKILRDSEEHMKLLENSGLDWTVVRSPAMTKFGDPKNFRLASSRPQFWQTINRISVAKAMVDQLDSKNWLHKAPFIVRG